MNVLYDELAPWWPLLSPVGDYAAEAAELRALLSARRPRARTLLELGSGGGHVAAHLKGTWACTLTDRSPAMLRTSRATNPECEHLEGDMRTLRLARAFDLVLVHDAIDYLTTESELRDAFATARSHLGPGGLALFVPDDVTETYAPGTDVSGGDDADGRGARIFEWSHPPGADGAVAVDYVFLVRAPGGGVTVRSERHRYGLFPRATWERLLAEAGFEPEVILEPTNEGRAPRLLFFGHVPEAA